MNELSAIQKGIELCMEHNMIYSTDNQYFLSGKFVDAVLQQLDGKFASEISYDLNAECNLEYKPIDIAIMSSILTWTREMNEDELSMSSMILKKMFVVHLNNFWSATYGNMPKPRLW